MRGFPLTNLEILLENWKEISLLWQEQEGTRNLHCTILHVIHTVLVQQHLPTNVADP
jgi:hypothetical protein